MNHLLITSIYSFLGRLQQFCPWKRSISGIHQAFLLNTAAFENHIPELQSSNGYIENQRSYTDLSYGKSSIQRSGCGVIAVYNALRYLNKEQSLTKLIVEFEKDGMVFNGFGGTAPKAIQRFLVRNGIENSFSCHTRDFASLAATSRCIILTMFNDRKDIRRQMHTICVTREISSSGKTVYLAHNVMGNGTVIDPCPDFGTLMKTINDGRSEIFFLIGIS